MSDLAALAEALSDRYAIERELGAGGMATVYLAEDLKHKRKVAVKVLRPELAAVLGGERFLNEIRVTANLQHPHILPLHDSGKADSGKADRHQTRPEPGLAQSGQADSGPGEFLYYVMPFVEGESLRERLNREKQLPIDDALAIASEVADALGSAHRQGVIHRDIKPENILLREGHALVADFGIALAVTSAGGDRLTETGLSLGTPAYMSPEQVAGEREIDARSDIYSLACVLYEMLAGQPPFTGATAQIVLARHVTDPVPPITTARSSVSPAVATAITKALGKAPVDRYASTHEFAEALTAKETAPAPPAEKSVAVLPLENLMVDPEQEFFVDGMTDALITNLAKVGGMKVISRTSIMQYKGTRKPLPEIAEELNVGVLVEGSVMRAGNQVRITAQLIDAASDRHLWAESYDGTLDDIFELQSEVAGAIANEIRTTLTPEEERRLAPARQVDLEAHELYLKGRQCHFAWEEEGFQRAVRYFEQAAEKDPQWALPYAAQAESYWLRSFVSTEQPSEHLEKMRSAAEKAVELNDTFGDPLAILACARMIEEHDWERARVDFERALELGPDAYTPHMMYGSFYLTAMGDHDRAESEVRFCLELDPLNMGAAVELAWVLHVGHKFDETVRELRRILEMDPNNPMAVSLLGYTLEHLSEYDEAVDAHEKAAVISQRSPFFLMGLARGYSCAGRKEEAAEILGDLSANWPDTYATPYHMAGSYAALGKPDNAIEWMDRAYDVRDPWLVMANEDPALDPVRSDSRFQDLMRRMKFPEIRR